LPNLGQQKDDAATFYFFLVSVFVPGVDYHLTIAMASFVISVKFNILSPVI